MAIRLSDPITTELRSLTPGYPETLIYICGVTPYDAAHLGHIATFMTYDVLIRRLRELGHPTRTVRNITDLDEPIIGRAQQIGVPYQELVDREVAQLKEDLRRLNFVELDSEPRVSSMLGQTIDFARDLEKAGYAYLIDGHLYFDSTRSPTFGSVSGYPRDLMLHYARERGGNPDDPTKRVPLDFLLWRPSKPGEPVHDSPWGAGMPGWHIGCSAMARALLGKTIDLHGGGVDLRFPHHECESAQTLALQTEPFVRTWHHCEFVSYRGAKMSKSQGNVVLARNLLKRHAPGAIRLAILRQYRYRAGCEWRDNDIVHGERLYDLLQHAARRSTGPAPAPWAERVRAAIDDDLDFPTATAELEQLARAILAGGDNTDAPAVLVDLAGMLGVNLDRDA